MSAYQGDIDGGSLNDARRRLALAQEARANATREQIEARGIRPDVEQIIRHMNRAPSHSTKRTRLNDSMARRVYEDDDDDDNADRDAHNDKKAQEERAEFEEQWQGILAEEGFQDASMFLLAEFRQIAWQRIHMLKQASAQWQALCRPRKKDRFDLLGSLCTCTELTVEVCKHLRPLDIVHLYSIGKEFHRTISKHMRSSIFAWASYMAPTATRIYSSPVYHRWFIPDPAGRRVTPADQELSRTQPGQARLAGQEPLNEREGEVRKIPGLMWLQMVVGREMRVRDMIACLARRGHRLPEGSHLTLKKIWLVMDAATSQARMILLNNPDFFSDEDVYIAQLFMVKLVLAFNDPVFGPQSSSLMRLMMGQRGLTPLWQLLRGKRYRTALEMRQLKLRYDVVPEQVDESVAAQHGVPVDELGVVHFEGWGQGPDHLLRPDQLIPLEAARRQLDLDRCVDEMMIFGHVDFATGNSLVPSLDEMYMSDDDLAPACKDWKPLKRELIHSGCGNGAERGIVNGEGMQNDGEGLPQAAVVRHGDGGDEDMVIMMGEEEEGDMMAAEMGGGGMLAEVDWDHFLSNPGAYTVESEGVVALVQDDDDDGDETEEDGGGMNMNNGEHGDAHHINMLMGGLEVGQAQADAAQQVFQQAADAAEDDEIHLVEYTVDEDLGEDERTRKLRDWFRPW
ncbi:hypothetical protein N658DRAFT_419029 [Parathielavia hyrcaniae]|uniref:Uncharacterized protein n=1 Tax=Parathielavia hyrcaniae TaxID=113614 RepID=A0AAN6T524_9PEZI|nr:hypothetical protein N658DRAFT_419029 [Parathielavia hyrcaniae]